jgi:hypothetical protein
MSMARLRRDRGKRDAARELLAPVYAWVTEGFDTLDLKEAKALLDELAASRPLGWSRSRRRVSPSATATVKRSPTFISRRTPGRRAAAKLLIRDEARRIAKHRRAA